jgi:hypothetical protein
MQRFRKIAMCLAGGLVLAAAAPAANPYAAIVERNVFGLNPPKPVDIAPHAPSTPPPKIKVNGIMGYFGHWRVLFKVAVPPEQGKPAKEDSYVLSEGQRQDDVEVTRIDEKSGVITFNNHGTVQEIPLADTPKTSAPPPRMAAIPAPAGMPNIRNLPPGIAARFNRGRLENNNAGSNTGSGAAAPRIGGTTQTQQIDPATQMVIIAAEHAEAQKKGDPTAAIYPPTPLDKDAGVVGPPAPPGGGSSK